MVNDNYVENRGDYQNHGRELMSEEEAVELLRQLEPSRMMSMLLDFGTSQQTRYLAPPHIIS